MMVFRAFSFALCLISVNSICISKWKQECYNITVNNWSDIKKQKSETKLDIHDSYIPKLSSDLFNNFIKLTVLNLTNCRIEYIEPDSFISLKKLTHLAINHNSLTLISSLHNNLIFLDISYNEINDGLEFLHNMQELEELYLQNNRIENLSDAFNNLTKLKILNLSNNKLKKLPSNIFLNVKSLTNINLSYNIIEEIEKDVFTSSVNLQIINLMNNKLKELSSNVFLNLTNLIYIHLDNNEIETIDEDVFNQNIVLKKITLSNNNIKLIPSKLFQNKYALEYLTLQNNLIQNIDKITFSTCAALKFLDLDSNSIQEIENETFTLLNVLEYLILSNNLLTEINDMFMGFSKIKYIDLSHNFISSDINCANCLKLNTLKLNDNQLSNCSITFNDGFVSIDLSDNFIEDIDKLKIHFSYNGYTVLYLMNNKIKPFNIANYLENNQHVQHIYLDSNSLPKAFAGEIISHKSIFHLVNSTYEKRYEETEPPLVVISTTETSGNDFEKETATEKSITTQDSNLDKTDNEENSKLSFTIKELVLYCLASAGATAVIVGGSCCFYNCLRTKNLKQKLKYENESMFDEIDYRRVPIRDHGTASIEFSEVNPTRPTTYFVPMVNSTFKAPEEKQNPADW